MTFFFLAWWLIFLKTQNQFAKVSARKRRRLMTFFFLAWWLIFLKTQNQFAKVSARKRRRLMTFFFDQVGEILKTSKPFCQSLGAKTAPPYDIFFLTKNNLFTFNGAIFLVRQKQLMVIPYVFFLFLLILVEISY